MFQSEANPQGSFILKLSGDSRQNLCARDENPKHAEKSARASIMLILILDKITHWKQLWFGMKSFLSCFLYFLVWKTAAVSWFLRNTLASEVILFRVNKTSRARAARQSKKHATFSRAITTFLWRQLFSSQVLSPHFQICKGCLL